MIQAKDTNQKMPVVVNLIPSWQMTVRPLLSNYRATEIPDVLRAIEQEFERMARLADAYAEEHKDD